MHELMAFHSRKNWNAFSLHIQELRWALLSWLESLLGREAKLYSGSDSFLEPPKNWSKYKLVPYDHESMPPLVGLDNGVLVCIDADDQTRIEHAKGGNDAYSRIPWHPTKLAYKVGRERVYRVVPFPTGVAWRERRPQLVDLATVIRDIEQRFSS